MEIQPAQRQQIGVTFVGCPPMALDGRGSPRDFGTSRSQLHG